MQFNNSTTASSAGAVSSNSLSQLAPTNQSIGQQQTQAQQQQQQQQQSNSEIGSTSSADASGPRRLTMQIPMPTPVGDMGNQSQQASQQQMAQMQQVQNQQNGAASQQAMSSNQFAQLLAQQVGALQQQQQQQQQVQNQQQEKLRQQQQQQVAQQQAQQQQQQAMQVLQSLAMSQQQAQQQQQRQAVQQMQQAQGQVPPQQNGATGQPQQQVLQFTSDPGAFLQQLQFAQLQQQFQAAQAQANAQQQQQQQPTVQASTQASQQAKIQEKLRADAQARSQKANSKPPASKRQKTGSAGSKKKASLKKPPPSQSSTTAEPTTAPTLASAAGMVSASDTDCGGGSLLPKQAAASSASKDPSWSQNEADDASASDSHATPGDKAKANRDRNREHARNTRLRKKAYLEKLKCTVDDLCRERDILVSERAGAANLLVEMHNTRTEVLMSFFALRSANEKRRKLWASILDESCFACVMPVTPYRSFPASEVQVSKCQRTILGIDGMMTDTASLHVLFNSLVDKARFPKGKIDFRYTLVTEESVIAGNQMMARWAMTTTNAVQCGAKMEVAKHGMLCCRFNSGHKIIGLELMFDVMAFMLQLKQAAGSDGFSVIPNTVQTCQRTFDKPVVMTLAEPPYTIVQVNKLWEEMTGYAAEEVVGKASCGILEGAKDDGKAHEELLVEIRYKRPASASLTNYKKSGGMFRNFLLVFPLSTDSRVTHYLWITDQVDGGSSQSDAGSQKSSQPVQQSTTAGPGTMQPSAFAGAASVPGQLSLPTTSAPVVFSSSSQSSFPAPQKIVSGQQMPPPSVTVPSNVSSKRIESGEKRPREEESSHSVEEV